MKFFKQKKLHVDFTFIISIKGFIMSINTIKRAFSNPSKIIDLDKAKETSGKLGEFALSIKNFFKSLWIGAKKKDLFEARENKNSKEVLDVAIEIEKNLRNLISNSKTNTITGTVYSKDDGNHRITIEFENDQVVLKQTPMTPTRWSGVIQTVLYVFNEEKTLVFSQKEKCKEFVQMLDKEIILSNLPSKNKKAKLADTLAIHYNSTEFLMPGGEKIDRSYHDGVIYSGALLNDKCYGEGTLKFTNGDVYEGTFTNGRFNGKGTVTYADGAVYKGDFADGVLFHRNSESKAHRMVSQKLTAIEENFHEEESGSVAKS